ncbi:MAG: hypothetical protein RIQ52_1023 [Pseudomonadota bacterium]
MSILALGLNHKTAPVHIRERFAFPNHELRDVLRGLTHASGLGELAILSTCNRTEIYCGGQDAPGQDRAFILLDWLAQRQSLPPGDLQPYLYLHRDAATIRHIFRVASGLDSLVLGEPQILGQMKAAYQEASDAGTLGKVLARLFQHTFSAAKKVRTDTAIGSSPVSVAFAAVRLAQRIFDSLKTQTVVLVGAGETMELTARHFAEQGIGELIVANRTYDRAHLLASRHGGFAISLEELPRHLARADIVVTATGSACPIIGKGSVESALRIRRHKPMLLVDLAVPRDIEPEVAQLRDVYLYTVDDLHSTVEEGLRSRQEAAKQAEEIIDTEVEHFLSWMRVQDMAGTLLEMRNQAEQLRCVSLEKAVRALRAGADAEEILEALSRQLTNRLMHLPSAGIRQACMDERYDLVAAARELFQIKDNDSA